MEKPIPNVHKKKVQVRTPPHQNWSFVQFPGVSVPLDAMATLLSYLDELPSAAHRMLDAAGWCPPPHDERERADGDVADLVQSMTIQPKSQEGGQPSVLRRIFGRLVLPAC